MSCLWRRRRRWLTSRPSERPISTWKSELESPSLSLLSPPPPPPPPFSLSSSFSPLSLFLFMTVSSLYFRRLSENEVRPASRTSVVRQLTEVLYRMGDTVVRNLSACRDRWISFIMEVLIREVPLYLPPVVWDSYRGLSPV